MKAIQRSVAALEMLLIFPAVLFMTALFARGVQPVQFEPAHTAQRIVDWYAARTHVGLWLFLIGLPLAVLVSGSIELMRNWRQDASLREAARSALAGLRSHLAVFLLAGATTVAGGILAIVALHLLTD